MKSQIVLPLQSKGLREALDILYNSKERKILNFLNQHDMFHIKNEKIFRESISGKENTNFVDGFILSLKAKRTRGIQFTKVFLTNKQFSERKRHFFILADKNDLNLLRRKFSHLNHIEGYSPPFIKDQRFDDPEIAKMASLINKFGPDIVWVGIGSPKQNILSYELFKRTRKTSFVNIGAALDFLIGKKKEIPKIFISLGLEWFYRLVTDFKNSKKKVWRSFLAVIYLITGKVKISTK